MARATATLSGKRLVGGGPGTRLPFSIPFNGAALDIVVANLRIEVDVTIVAGLVTKMSGVLGGAVPKATLIEGLQGLPDDALPISKDAAVSLIESFESWVIRCGPTGGVTERNVLVDPVS